MKYLWSVVIRAEHGKVLHRTTASKNRDKADIEAWARGKFHGYWLGGNPTVEVK